MSGNHVSPIQTITPLSIFKDLKIDIFENNKKLTQEVTDHHSIDKKGVSIIVWNSHNLAKLCRKISIQIFGHGSKDNCIDIWKEVD